MSDSKTFELYSKIGTQEKRATLNSLNYRVFVEALDATQRPMMIPSQRRKMVTYCSIKSSILSIRMQCEAVRKA